MALESRHPLFLEYAPLWEKMRHCYEGEDRVKQEGVRYLPPTSSMEEEGALQSTTSEGWQQYDAYRKRARYPEYVQDAVDLIVGVMHGRPPRIELPPELEYLRERATRRGESLEVLLRRVNTEQWLTGRLGLLGDFYDGAPDRDNVYLTLYYGEQLVNWDEGDVDEPERDSLNLVVIDESAPVRKPDLEWEQVQKYRVLMLGEVDENEAAGAGAVYSVGTFRDDEGTLLFDTSKLEAPTFRGSTFDSIPFEFVNDRDVVAEPTKPPLLALANLCLSMYRGDADYRQALFMQGQDTLVIKGPVNNVDVNRPLRTGAGARIDLSTEGDAKFIGVDSSGLSELRSASENDHAQARERSGQLLDATSRERESGEALRMRISARTATVKTVALAGAFAVQSVLRKMARWRGLDPESVVIEPNLDFVVDPMTAKELGELMTAKTGGAPISLKTVHDNMRRRGVTDLEFEEELKEIGEEEPLIEPTATPSADPVDDDPNADDPNADDPNADDQNAAGQ